MHSTSIIQAENSLMTPRRVAPLSPTSPTEGAARGSAWHADRNAVNKFLSNTSANVLESQCPQAVGDTVSPLQDTSIWGQYWFREKTLSQPWYSQTSGTDNIAILSSATTEKTLTVAFVES